jgi:L-lactate dehydrogenase complex protein LldF
MDLTPKNVKQYIKDALANPGLKKAVDNATTTAVNKRRMLVEKTAYWEELRRRNHAAKREILADLAGNLERFEKHCHENHIQLLWASDSEEAKRLILDLAREKGVKKIVKSKSLTTEEIHLNPALIAAGIETIETDLGEYIVQLMDQIPSHLTMPALHLSRRDIGKLFHEKLGTPYTHEPVELLTIARRLLREHFLTADMGITGANFGVVDSGVVTIIENEANAHLTISLPRIHVAVMGIEKLVPDMKSLAYFLRVLAASATGQKSSCYVNFVGGPSRQKYGEGPEEVYVVLVDNGRTRMAKDPQLWETLACIRCGSCLNHCPVYQQVGGHAYGWVYMGPIGICLIPQFLGEDEGRLAPTMCSLCGECFVACPVRIDLPRHILELRRRVAEKGYTQGPERFGMAAWSQLVRHPVLYKLATWFPGKLQLLMPRGKSFPAPGYTKERSLPEFDTKGFRKRFNEMKEKSGK